MHKYISLISFFYLITFFSITSLHAQSKENNYLKYIDSAYNTYSESPELALKYLDSIPKPLKKSLTGNLSEYYRALSLINSRLNNTAELFQNHLMTLKYAKIEKNHDLAGIALIDIFYNKYFIENDTTAFSYLENARHFFEKTKNRNGLAEVKQMYAYVELCKKNYAKSNSLILKHLSEYKSIKDDRYYYMYALFMLSSNYIDQGDLTNSHKYFHRLKAIKQDSITTKYLHDLHKVSINIYIAKYHLDNNTTDSTLFYLKQSEKLRYAMNTSDIKLFFKAYADYYEMLEDSKSKEKYIDSLSKFQSELVEKNIKASLKINESLEKSESLLEEESNKKLFNKNLAIILCFAIGIFSIAVVIGYKKFKKRIKTYAKKEDQSSYLKSNHEKLKVKVRGLEDYIDEIKKQVKEISSMDSTSEQRIGIKELYKKIHINSSTLLSKGSDHFELVNDLNVNFFTQIAEKHPRLNQSEIIVCYYIFLDFKNKEIAAFLNTTYRAIEAKRYRIRKKIELKNEKIQLAEYLKENF